jgi:hypothetical protein
MALDPDTLSRAATFSVALGALLVGHQVGDHVVQTDRQAARKAEPGRYGRGAAVRAMAGHLAGYHVCLLATLLGSAAVLRLPLTAAGVVAAMVFSAVTHGFLDLRWPVRATLRAAGSPGFAQATTPVCGLYLADQALHRLALLVSALLLVAV